MPITPSLPLLERALQQTAVTISRVRPDQAGLPTPCPEFTLRALLNHIVSDLQLFTASVSGGERGSPDADLIGDDWIGAFDRARASLLEAWRERGVEGTFASPMGELPLTWRLGQHLADVAVHAWDVSRASHQSTRLDPEVARVALDWGRENLKPQLRGRAFGPEVEVPENAPIYERLAGFFGRNPFQ